MSGYRQTSYDPEAYEQPGAPLRPYNWVQWTGVGLIAFGLVYLLVFLAGELGVIQPITYRIHLALFLPVLGSLLINSRRQPATLAGREQLARNRRLLAITTAVLGLLALVLLLVQFSGVI